MRPLEENFRFMVLEVVKQVENVQRAFDEPGSVSPESIETRDDYIDNLKSVIENDCFARIHGQYLDKRTVDRIRAMTIVTSNLEKLADYAENISGQIQHLTDPAFMQRYEYRPMFREVLDALDRVYRAVVKQDMSLAFKICKSEFNLDSMYKAQFDRILQELRSGTEVGNLITSLFIFRYLERMGDALLNIGEASIFSITGEKFKIHQYNALLETLKAADPHGEGHELGAALSEVEFESIWGTRSGCRIGRVQKSGPVGEDGVSSSLIFKEGSRKKLLKERDNILRWEQIMPGLPPKVQALQEDGGSVSLLIEYLGGCTFQDVVLAGQEDILENALFLITNTVQHIWEGTLLPVPVHAQFMRQATSRLADVYRLHPEFRAGRRVLCGMEIESMEDLIDAAADIDSQLPAPFSVFIHGDYNINNIVYRHEEQRIHYIDLHRSADSDYVQDVSVFLVSNYRLPVFQEDSRQRIRQAMAAFLAFARNFARQHGDVTFEARLCLGLARSFVTSTRFELNRVFARRMFTRGVYLLEKLLAFVETRPVEEFTLPEDVLRI